jgi:hypothetical protein
MTKLTSRTSMPVGHEERVPLLSCSSLPHATQEIYVQFHFFDASFTLHPRILLPRPCCSTLDGRAFMGMVLPLLAVMCLRAAADGCPRPSTSGSLQLRQPRRLLA